MVAIRGHFDGKVIVPDQPVDLPCNEPLIVRIEAAGARPTESASFFNWAAENPIDDPTLPPDLAHQHDHYLHGTPKRKPRQMSRIVFLSFEIMRRDGIHEALTTDPHFEQAGYTALLRQNQRL